MKKHLLKLLALAMAASFVLGACSSTGETEPKADNNAAPGVEDSKEPAKKPEKETAAKGDEIKDLVIARLSTREMETFNILYSQSFSDFENLTNMIDSLVEVDPQGKVVPAIAETWGTEDEGLTWTFHIREGVKWVDMNGQVKGDCTAWDWATGLEWVLNYHKNESSHTSQPIEMIAGAGDYYEYTKALSKEEAYALDASAGSKFMEMVGVEVPDDLTLIYRCPEPKPYFDSFPAWAGLYPMAQGMVDELGVDGVKAMDNTNYWYNGCYTMTTYIQNNEKVFTKNPEYWDKNCQRFDTVTVKMVESNDVAFQLYKAGEIDQVTLTESNLQTIYNNPNHEFYNYLVELPADKYAYPIHLNYAKNKEDGTPDTNWNTAVANEAFRLSWLYGIDLTEYYKRTNSINPLSCENNFYSMKGLIYNSDGTEYTELVHKEMGLPALNGKTMVRIDKDKAQKYKEQAIEELTALGVTFPVEVDYYIAASSQTALDSANVLKNCFEASLGPEYVQLNIKTYVSAYSKEVRIPRLMSFNVNGWGADFGDPINYLGQEIMGNDSAYYSNSYSYINLVEETEATKDLLAAYAEFTRLVDEANKITNDLDARHIAFAKAEAYMVQHGLIIPCNYSVSWGLTKVNPYSKMNAIFGCQNDKMKNWETNANGYTTEEMKAAAAAIGK